jgi:hypothetical protein
MTWRLAPWTWSCAGPATAGIARSIDTPRPRPSSCSGALPHLERGGEAGGIAFFGNHSNNGLLYEVLDEDLNLVANVTMEVLIDDWKANS